MITYIVRVYRRDDNDVEKIMGMAEIVETREKKAFASYTELRDILSLSKDGKGLRKEKGRRPRREALKKKVSKNITIRRLKGGRQ
jgi:predicted nucleic acid-binding OB-fold protein